MKIKVTEKTTGKVWYYPYTEGTLKTLEFLSKEKWIVEVVTGS